MKQLVFIWSVFRTSMEHLRSTHGWLILFTLLHGFILLCMSSRLGSATLPSSSTTFGKEADRLALLDLKRRITKDPFNIMNSWNDSTNLCSWAGVICNHSTKRVSILNLDSQKLVGSLPPSIGNLTHLTGINLINNSFQDEIPQEIGRLRSLQYLNLSYNSFGGKIPTNISHCKQLRVLDLGSNEIIGWIPNKLSSLFNLNRLWLEVNNLSGPIPNWIGNFSSLNGLLLYRNNFQGNIPNELGHLKGLEVFGLSVNNISGMIPSSICNISSIYIFDVSMNQLHGELPPKIGISLRNLKIFFGGGNKFTGAIPVSFANASRLRILDFSYNVLTGTVPAENLGSLGSLAQLTVGHNKLNSGKAGDLNFLSFLANCTSLERLDLDSNRFGGELPGSIANLSTQLEYLFFGGNLIYGNIPVGIGNLVNLISLGLDQTYLGGTVPDVIGKLQKLVVLFLNANNFSGLIPYSLGNLTTMVSLYMDNNRFEGTIPPSLGNCQNLLMLDLSSNSLTGVVTKELLGLSSLSVYLRLSNNYLTGSLPSEVGSSVHLVELDVSRNKLSGNIPSTLGSCVMLSRLYLNGNEFEGIIPQSFKSLRSLEEIDISHNKLSGQIPDFLTKFIFLKYLNLSHNDFAGELPKDGIFSNASGVSIIENNNLCGGIPELRLHACPSKKPHSSQRHLPPKVIIPIACALVFIIALSIAACLVVKKSRGKHATSRSYQDWKSGVSYSELVESTNGFSLENLIGSGSFGSVYRGVVPSDGTLVAVKVLNLQLHGAFKSFIDECKVLRSIRHRNLLKIITACSSIDNQGNDFKSLVFKYMGNGNLDSWLHLRDDDQSEIKRLSLIQRLNIAIDVASALDYLHHHCETPIVHCDLKPSNVLLDEEMVAHVGDFGLAKFLSETFDNPSQGQTMSTGLKGSIGYIPPKYGMGGQVSILGDTYSFGILLLEMLTGKRPTDDMLDGLSIQQFTARATASRTEEIVDPSLIIERDDADVVDERYNNVGIQERPMRRRFEKCLVSLMHVGLSCSAMLPAERMLMNVVVSKLKTIRDSFLNLRRRT